MSKQPLFSENTKLYEMIDDNPKLLQLLPRFDIKLGFGDRNVAEVCQQNHVSTRLFLMVCNLHFDPDTPLHPTTPDDNDMDSLLAYLNASHRFYLEDRFPHIEEHLGRIIEAAGAKFGNMLSHFYNEYKHEMVKHFQYEEDVVFPYIEALRKGSDTGAYTIEQFLHNHSNIEDALEDMTNILIKYLPGDILPDERICIATDIIELSADLVSHSLIEEQILTPYVEALENAKP